MPHKVLVLGNNHQASKPPLRVLHARDKPTLFVSFPQ